MVSIATVIDMKKLRNNLAKCSKGNGYYQWNLRVSKQLLMGSITPEDLNKFTAGEVMDIFFNSASYFEEEYFGEENLDKLAERVLKAPRLGTRRKLL